MTGPKKKSAPKRLSKLAAVVRAFALPGGKGGGGPAKGPSKQNAKRTRSKKKTMPKQSAAQSQQLASLAHMLGHQPAKPHVYAEGKVKGPSRGGAASFDPLLRSVPPSMVALRHVFPMNVLARMEYDTPLNHRTMIFVSGWGGTANSVMMVSASFSGVYIQTAFAPILQYPAKDGGASSSKISKVGLRVANTTPQLYRGGRAFLAVVDQRLRLPALAGAMTGPQWMAVGDSIKTLPPHMCQPIDLVDFGSGGSYHDRCIYAGVDDEVDYALFDSHRGAYVSTTNLDFARGTAETPGVGVNNILRPDDVTDWFKHISLSAGAVPADELTRPMSTVVLVIEAPSMANYVQNLNIDFPMQVLTRWPLETVPGQQTITIEAADSMQVNLSRANSLSGGRLPPKK